MTKILILSDSHGLTSEITKIKERHKEINHIIHCGDSELEVDHPVLKNVINVKGNCDYDAELKYIQQIDINKLNFYVTHGHLYNVGMDLQELYQDAKNNGAQIVCYGHTHIAGAQKIGEIIFVNPGSIRSPRQRKEKTYAIMDWENGNEIHIDFYTDSGDVLEELTYFTSLKV